MENATKALLMAGGMLLALMVVSLLVIFYNSLTSYQRSKQSNLSEEQIAKFNKEYEAYDRDITGFELVSLINKILSYNAQNTVSSNENDWENNNTDKAYTEMYLEFTIIDDQIKQLYKKGTYDTQKKSYKQELDNIRRSIKQIEDNYGGATVMSRLAGMTDYKQEVTDEVKRALGLKQSDNLTESDLPSENEVKTYQHYIDFKRANFTCTETKYDEKTGRIIKLIFVQK